MNQTSTCAGHDVSTRARLQRGFTLVELVTVILILGVLAAVALPRYSDFQGKARAAKLSAVMGAMKSATGIVKATAMASAVSCGADMGPTVTLEGKTVELNYCYPQAIGFGGGILAASNIEESDGWQIDPNSYPRPWPGYEVRVNLLEATDPPNCSISYRSPGTPNSLPVISNITSGC